MRKLKMWLAIRTPWVWMTSPSRRPYSPMAEFPNIVQILWPTHTNQMSGMSEFSPMIMFVCFHLSPFDFPCSKKTYNFSDLTNQSCIFNLKYQIRSNDTSKIWFLKPFFWNLKTKFQHEILFLLGTKKS